MKNNSEVLTIIICTYNSERYLRNLITNIQQQSLTNKHNITILLIDGGSSDQTLILAKELGLKVILNKKGNAIDGKFLGFNTAQSKYICFIDHDESFSSTLSLERRLEAFFENNHLVASVASGYEIKQNAHSANSYASEFGDPWSRFYYKTSNNEKYRIKEFNVRLNKVIEKNGKHEYYIDKNVNKILLELVTSGTIIDRKKLIELIPEVRNNKYVLPNLLYHLSRINQKRITFAVMDSDPIIHAPSDKWSLVLKKINWRIANAIHMNSEIASGFILREELNNTKKYVFFQKLLFVLYCVLIFPLVFDSVRLAFSRKSLGYLMQIPISYYLLFATAFFVLLKRNKNVIRRYDGS
jgi:glycosyltransferase involved in cell wall biosynthesis